MKHVWAKFPDVQNYPKSFLEFVRTNIPIKADYKRVLTLYGDAFVNSFKEKMGLIHKSKNISETPELV